MEASTLQPPATLTQPRSALGAPLLRIRSDEQLVALFRAGHDEAFRAIHDRYHKRLFAYARQMLPGRQDAEDALQDVFVRAYAGLRASDRDLALRPWLFRVAHNRCIDELRKPAPPPPEVLQLVRTVGHDPLAEVDLRESLRRLVEDIRRLPDQQRSALLMRELAGMSYVELASSLGVTVGAVKSLLVRARMGLVQAAAARDTSCSLIREELVEAHDRGMRPTANVRKHVRDCSACKSFRRELRGVSRQLAATAPVIGPLGFLANVLGFSGGGGAAGGAGSGAALIGGGGMTASATGIALSTGHVATLIVAAVATAGGAVEIQHTILPAARHAALGQTAHPKRHRLAPALTAVAPLVSGVASVNTAPATIATPRVVPDARSPVGAVVTTHVPAVTAAGSARNTAGAATKNKSHSDSAASGTPTTGTGGSATGCQPAGTATPPADGAAPTAVGTSSTGTALTPTTSSSSSGSSTASSCGSGSSSSTSGSASASSGTSGSSSSAPGGTTGPTTGSSSPPASGSAATTSPSQSATATPTG